uniref:Uncharacterized protein n=1 Tax=Anguilla anguilla TaxID=7936 RepID=A0A0E9SW89_ANGAN
MLNGRSPSSIRGVDGGSGHLFKSNLCEVCKE